MKKESTVHYVLRLTLTLLVITSVVAVALAGVNAVTEPRIAALEEEKTQTAIEAVLPGGGEAVAFTDETGMVSQVYQGEQGWAVQVTPTGFNGGITMMVGVGTDGSVLGSSFVAQSETAGLGAVAAANTSAGEAFRAQFAGQSGTVSVSKDGGQIDSITGATITSRAICTGVSAALECAANFG